MTTLHEAAQMAFDALYSGDSPPNARQQAAADAIREALAAPEPEPVALESVHLTRDTQGMCVVRVNGQVAIRDNGDIIDHTATLEWFAAPPGATPPAAPAVPLTEPVLWAVTVDGRFQPHFCAKTRAGAEGLRDALKHQTAPCDLKSMQVVPMYDAPPAAPAPVVREPLKGDEIYKIAMRSTPFRVSGMVYVPEWVISFARAVEAAHGITGGGNG